MRKIGILIVIVLSIVYKPIKSYYIDNRDFSLEYTNVAPIGFFITIKNNILKYKEYQKDLTKSMDILPNWEILGVKPQYKNYILVIGESMRSDYMSLYGYPINTTPFLSSTNGLIIDGYISAAPNTQPSLLRTLYSSANEQFYYQNNIITLAKSAGFDTYWISNQGRIGEFDTVASRVASDANHIIFTKKGGYDSNHTNDKILVDILNNFVSIENDNPRLFVLHLMGSHPEFCERLDYQPETYFLNKKMSCYLETLKQTDLLIKNIIALFNREESYSLIYFSDHGLSHQNKGGELSMFVNNKYKQNYQVPFVKLSSDDKNRVLIKTQRSAFNFLSGFSEWLGIKEKNLSNYVGFFSDKKDQVKVFDWEKIIEFDTLPDDVAISP